MRPQALRFPVPLLAIFLGILTAAHASGQQTATPVISPGPGTYPVGQLITITDATPGAVIYYSLHNVLPTTSSTPYTGPISISGTVTVRAIAIAPGHTLSADTASLFVELPQAAAPVFAPGPGTFSYDNTVTITASVPDSAIYYTTDGTVPTTASRFYNSPVALRGNVVLSAIAVAPRTEQSMVTTASYNVVTPAPVIRPGSATVPVSQKVVITDSMAGAAIYYTLDGSDPITHGTRYTAPFTLTQTRMVNAAAIAPGFTRSSTVSGAFVVTTLTTIAGGDGFGYSGDGGPALGATFNFPQAITFDRSGNLYVADSGNHCFRKIDGATGIITDFVLACDNGYPYEPQALQGGTQMAFDSQGNFYYTDSYNNIIRKVDAMSGVNSIYAGVPYVIGLSGVYFGDGGLATSAHLNSPAGIAFDRSDNLYIADSANNAIRKVDAISGIITRVAGNGTQWGVQGSGSYGGDGKSAKSAALNYPVDVAFDSEGNLYIADYDNSAVRKVAFSTGIITTYAGDPTNMYNHPPPKWGDGGPATEAGVSVSSIAFDAQDNLFIANPGLNEVREVYRKTGIINTVAGNILLYDGGNNVPATSVALTSLSDIATDSAGNLYILEYRQIQKVSLSAAPAPPL